MKKDILSWNDVKEKYLIFHKMDSFTENMSIDIDFGYWLVNNCNIPDVMHRSIEFAKYATLYYELCYEIEPCWLNKNNHEKYTSNQVYNAFVKYLNNGA